LVGDVSKVYDSKKHIFVETNNNRLFDSFWPGPLTILFEKNENLASNVTAGQLKVCFILCLFRFCPEKFLNSNRLVLEFQEMKLLEN
jgi:hypothetical protein